MHSLKLNYLKLLVLILTVASFAGCANIRQYSIESYQGPFPTHDRQYLTITEP